MHRVSTSLSPFIHRCANFLNNFVAQHPVGVRFRPTQIEIVKRKTSPSALMWFFMGTGGSWELFRYTSLVAFHFDFAVASSGFAFCRCTTLPSTLRPQFARRLFAVGVSFGLRPLY